MNKLAILRIILLPLLLLVFSPFGCQPAETPTQHNLRGIDLMEEGSYDRAISEFTKAIELDPKFVEAYKNRGIAYQKKGEVDKAISDLEKAIELSDNVGFRTSVQKLLDELKE